MTDEPITTTAKTPVEEVCDYLKKAGIYYLGTIGDGKPRVRPFGTAHLFEGKLYIQTGRRKAIYQQLQELPYVEICACEGMGGWLRVEARVQEDPRIEAQASMLDDYPELQGMYQPGDGNNCVFYLVDAKATFTQFGAEPRTVEF